MSRPHPHNEPARDACAASPEAPHEALRRLLARLDTVTAERVALAEAAGRFLAQDVVADRPSPACDVSSMDGYALRMADSVAGRIAVAGEIRIGEEPPALPPAAALKIVTGAPIPPGAETVIPRERVAEHGDAIVLNDDCRPAPGDFIRRTGENGPQGHRIALGGRGITPPVVGALASFGLAVPQVYRKVRVALIVTGDEVLDPEAEVSPWQLRDSNGPVLRAAMAALPFVEVVHVDRVPDEPRRLAATVDAALSTCDAVFLTGGVSMGDRDHVPAIIRQAGCEVVFHRLPLRPGKPILGAVGPRGQAVLALPGNPVSVMVGVRRFGFAVLRRRAGAGEPEPPVPTVAIGSPGDATLHLWWYRPVTLTGHGRAAYVANRGSGDYVATATSHGFVEVPPERGGEGPWPFYTWA